MMESGVSHVDYLLSNLNIENSDLLLTLTNLQPDVCDLFSAL